MKKYIAFLLFALVGSVSYAQTTVTLEDQCDCQVLSGTDVNTAGQATPTGSEAGDIYVNTTTGIIYYWDGDSWELTSGLCGEAAMVVRLDWTTPCGTPTERWHLFCGKSNKWERKHQHFCKSSNLSLSP